MRIWLVRHYEPMPTIDGTGRYLRYGMLARALTDRGHEVVLWTSNFDHARKKQRFEDPPLSVEMWPGCDVRFLPAHEYKANVSLNRVRHNLSMAKAFEKRARQSDERPDIILTCLPTLELADNAIQYGRANGIPVVVDVEDEWPDLYLSAFPKSLRGLARALLSSEFRRAERILKSATAIVACSNTYLNWALEYAGRSRTEFDEVFPLGYMRPEAGTESECEEWRTRLQSECGVRPDAFVVTFLGQFGASYDLETVVEAARILNSKAHEGVQFVLAGHGDKSAKLREQAHGLPNVSFTGWLDHLGMIALLGMSSVGLAAYTAEALQSLPYKPFEYMAAGLPIVSSLRGEFKALLDGERIGVNYNAGDPASLAECVRALSSQPEVLNQMGKRSLELFEQRFSMEAICPQFVEHLMSITRSATLNPTHV